MTDNHENYKKHSDVYSSLTSCITNSEQTRDARLNMCLVANSIFLYGIISLYASSNGNSWTSRLFMIGVCILGIVVNYLWVILSQRVCSYIDFFYKFGSEMEKDFPDGYHLFEKIQKKRDKQKNKWRSTFSIYTKIFPCMFIIAYSLLVVIIFVVCVCKAST